MTTFTTSTNRARIRRSEYAWRELVVRFEQSGQTREQFCVDQGLALSTFGRWRQRLRLAVQEEATRSADAVFVELATEEALASAAPTWDVELQLGADVVLRLRRATC